MKKQPKHLIPNILTLFNMFIGFLAIGLIINDQPVQAGIFVLFSGMFDIFDGKIARLLGIESKFGIEFDSMADLVSFGVAPAVLMLNTVMYLNDLSRYSIEFWILATSVSIFVLAGALRLARYNLTSDKPMKGWFSGIPITAAGGGLTATAAILLLRYEGYLNAEQINLYAPIFIVILAIGMVSTFKFPKMMKREGFYINLFQASNFIVSCYCAVTRSYPEFLFCMGIFLLLTGTIAGRFASNESQN